MLAEWANNDPLSSQYRIYTNPRADWSAQWGWHCLYDEYDLTTGTPILQLNVVRQSIHPELMCPRAYLRTITSPYYTEHPAATCSVYAHQAPPHKQAACGIGNPINVGIGLKVATETDSNGDNFTLPLNRVYRSQPSLRNDHIASRFGENWTDTYQRHLDYAPASSAGTTDTVYITRPDGKIVLYLRENGAWSSELPSKTQLNELTDAAGELSGWELVTQDHAVEYYDQHGRLIRIAESNGVSTALHYAPEFWRTSQLLRIQNDLGASLVFTYNENARVATITDHAGRTWHYQYDSNDNLVSVEGPTGVRRYHYEVPRYPHALTGITDERGIRYASYDYDDQGRAIMSSHANGADRVDVTYRTDGARIVRNSRHFYTNYQTVVQDGVALTTQMQAP